jgi:hypothetical protein
MKRTKISCLLLAALLCISLLSGCGNTNSSQVPDTEASVSAGNTTDPIQTADDENETAAEQLLQDLKGTYQELWPIVLADEYNQLWLDTSAELVGEDNAESAKEHQNG